MSVKTGHAIQHNPASTKIADYSTALLNILEDFSVEKERLERTQRAAINILEDFSVEKERLEGTQKAALNILDDFSVEKERLEGTQRAMLNLLDDFNAERTKTETANRELQETVESLRIAKETAETANRELETFSYSVSHDLRSPLRSIEGFSLAILEDYADKLDEKGKDYLNRVRNATIRMGSLIDDLLKLSHVNRSGINRESVNLSTIVKGIAAYLISQYPERSTEFIIPDNLISECDSRLLNIALENLLSNAWKFSEKCNRIVIEFGETYRENARVFFVRDNGVGFDMAHAGKLFNPFQRLHKTEDYPGTGIGLATVKRIINRHGGQVWFESGINKGTTVYFTL
ncbi:MAG: hypothetical protein EPN93_09775 [Spirochaetes bacterium]|nr:MAG: hypothetical protein EPN93_09775 [Spirochaetota bacterium]